MAIAFVRPEILYAWKGPSLLIVNTRGECGDDQPGRREQDGPVEISVHDDHVALTYRHPQLPFHTEVRHEGQWSFRGTRAVADVTLTPQQAGELFLRIVPFTDRDETSREVVEQRQAALQGWRDRFASVEVPGNRHATLEARL